MKLFFRFILLFCLIYSVQTYCSYGDLGETLVQLVSRYGEPVPAQGSYIDASNEKIAYSFIKKPYLVTAVFYNGVVNSEIIAKTDQSSFSDYEITMFLNHNSSPNKVWKAPITRFKARLWTRDDGATIIYSFTGHPFLSLFLAHST